MIAVASPPVLEPRLSPEALAFVRSVGTATDLPAFVRNVRAIATVAADLEARVSLLEQAITKDVALTGKVLRIASSAISGTGASVTSVKQAIMLLGYERVQHLSTATSVFDQIEQSAPQIQDLLVLSVLTANQSLGLAVDAGYGRPELAYLCGLFRNLGEVLVACYRARQYREWTESPAAAEPMAHGNEAEVFGFTFDEVGMALARQWGMPDELVATLCRVTLPDAPPADRLHHITQCSADLTRLTYAASVTAEHVAHADDLVSSYTRVLSIEEKKLRESLTSAQLDATPTLHAMQLTLDGWKAAREERAAALLQPQEATEAVALQSLAALCKPTDSDTASEASVRAAVGALTAVRQSDEAFTIGGATVATLDAARSAGYRRALLALSTEDFKLVRGRMGAGPGHEELMRSFIVRPLRASGPLGAALQSRTDLFVDVGTAEGRTYRTDRVLKELQSRSLAMLPLVVGDKLMGCLYFDNGTEPLEVTDTLRDLLLTMRDHLVAAFIKHRSAGVPSAA